MPTMTECIVDKGMPTMTEWIEDRFEGHGGLDKPEVTEDGDKV